MTKSAGLYERACRLMPGGVNSPVRAFKSVGAAPVYFTRGEGAFLYDADGKRYADFCGSWGPLILGHARKEVVEAVASAARNGLSFGACCPLEVEMAETLSASVPSLEMVRMVSSGTEAVMTALRLARGFTGKGRIIKFDGCYHGHSDSMLVSAGSGLLTGGISSSKGVPAKTVEDVSVIPYNDQLALERAADALGGELAAIIVEPVAGNMGLVQPKPGFLFKLREVANRAGCLLIFDEVITGFRFGPTSYGQLAGIKPDLTTLGKIVGGGMPVGAVGGRRDVMELLSPNGPVYQAGTLSGNPVSIAAGLATIETLAKENPYPKMAAQAKSVAEAIDAHASQKGLPLHCSAFGGVFTVFFTEKKSPLWNLADVKTCDTARYAAFFRGMLERGFYLPPSQFELCFLSAAHDDALLSSFVSACLESIDAAFK